MTERERFSALIKKYLSGTATDEEHEELMGMLRSEKNIAWLDDQVMQSLLAEEDIDGPELGRERAEGILKRIFTDREAPVVRLRRRRSPALIAAASLSLICVCVYLLTRQRRQEEGATAKATVIQTADVQPAGNKATLTLADGSTITLNKDSAGMLVQQGSTQVVQSGNGLLTYHAGGAPHAGGAAGAGGLSGSSSSGGSGGLGASAAEGMYNTIATPRGGQYQLVLPDGSKVWLNAASSLRFPTAFTGKERRVVLSGEAYFEVAKQKDMPFTVEIDHMKVEVLGTDFNLMGYRDENAIKTTLLKGAVRVVMDNANALLQPGQQASLQRGTSAMQVGEANLSESIAWKEGWFAFQGDNIGTIMRELGRWYDVETSYASKVPAGHFTGTIGRNIPLSQVLKMLEANDLHFRMEGKRIIVL
jgi:ferric-dicitrate binding protein FerR (iron transport regulator)